MRRALNVVALGPRVRLDAFSADGPEALSFDLPQPTDRRLDDRVERTTLMRSAGPIRGGMLFGLIACLIAPAAMAAAPPAPVGSPTSALSDGNGAFATGKYRNLFAELGYTDSQIDAKIQKAWKELFEGGGENEPLFTPAGSNEHGPLAYIPTSSTPTCGPREFHTG
jgi:hypothetical protein